MSVRKRWAEHRRREEEDRNRRKRKAQERANMKYPVGTKFHSYEVGNNDAVLRDNPMFGEVMTIKDKTYLVRWNYVDDEENFNTTYTEEELVNIITRLAHIDAPVKVEMPKMPVKLDEELFEI